MIRKNLNSVLRLKKKLFDFLVVDAITGCDDSQLDFCFVCLLFVCGAFHFFFFFAGLFWGGGGVGWVWGGGLRGMRMVGEGGAVGVVVVVGVGVGGGGLAGIANVLTEQVLMCHRDLRTKLTRWKPSSGHLLSASRQQNIFPSSPSAPLTPPPPRPQPPTHTYPLLLPPTPHDVSVT